MSSGAKRPHSQGRDARRVPPASCSRIASSNSSMSRPRSSRKSAGMSKATNCGSSRANARAALTSVWCRCRGGAELVVEAGIVEGHRRTSSSRDPRSVTPAARASWRAAHGYTWLPCSFSLHPASFSEHNLRSRWHRRRFNTHQDDWRLVTTRVREHPASWNDRVHRFSTPVHAFSLSVRRFRSVVQRWRRVVHPVNNPVRWLNMIVPSGNHLVQSGNHLGHVRNIPVRARKSFVPCRRTVRQGPARAWLKPRLSRTPPTTLPAADCPLPTTTEPRSRVHNRRTCPRR